MQWELPMLLDRIRRTGEIEFGGEYCFLVADSYEVALDKLWRAGCAIGGMVEGDGLIIKVYPCYDPGYWSFEWLSPDKGVRHIRYWTATVLSDELWNEESARLHESITGRKPAPSVNRAVSEETSMDTAERLARMAKDHNWTTQELADRLDIHPDRLNNGGIREVIELALADDDPEWIEEQIRPLLQPPRS